MKTIYLDHAAATPLRVEALEAMLPYLREHFGNALSLHSFGDAPREAVDKARAQVAALIGAQDKEIFFTSSGSEANNLALKGVALANQKSGKHIVTSQAEHYSVLNSARALEQLGFSVTFVPIDRFGLVDPQQVADAVQEDTILVSIIHASNEIGTIQPIAEIAKLVKARKRGLYFHTDAVMTVGSMPVNVEELGVDMLSLAGSAFYGPKGGAALYVRRGVSIAPLIDGGSQEKGRRAGTEDVPAIVGLGVAAELAQAGLPARVERLIVLRDRLIQGLTTVDRVHLTGHPTQRLPGLVSVVVEYVEGESMLLMLNMKGVAAASGSTCTSRSLKSSLVLTAIGLEPALAQGSLVFSLGEGNTPEDIEYVLESFPPIIARLRAMSPLYHKGA
jgi:cysteine desulfurase